MVIAAISVRGSTHQIPSSRLRELGGEMVRAARDLSLQLSGN
jgi:DNA-binding IclR family transcriptional regulator